jgi:hypothetical protein
MWARERGEKATTKRKGEKANVECMRVDACLSCNFFLNLYFRGLGWRSLAFCFVVFVLFFVIFMLCVFDRILFILLSFPPFAKPVELLLFFFLP